MREDEQTRALTRAARHYAHADARRADAEARLAALEREAEEAWVAVRALAPAAFAGCTTPAEWERLHDHIVEVSGSDDILVDLPLPRPRGLTPT